jgi:hypothetical protein
MALVVCTYTDHKQGVVVGAGALGHAQRRNDEAPADSAGARCERVKPPSGGLRYELFSPLSRRSQLIRANPGPDENGPPPFSDAGAAPTGSDGAT